VEQYIGYYEEVVPYVLCDSLINWNFNFKPSTYSSHTGRTETSDERVCMDEVWIKNGNVYYDPVKAAVEYVTKKYSEKHPLFSVQRMTDFRINRYSEGGFMSKHCDNIHHSHGQQYGFPQATVLLYLNDDYEGGEFYVADKKFEPKKGSAIIFPSNFMFPHEAKVVTKGMRWSVVAWLM